MNDKKTEKELQSLMKRMEAESKLMKVTKPKKKQ